MAYILRHQQFDGEKCEALHRRMVENLVGNLSEEIVHRGAREYTDGVTA
jgi:hypothetical protein